MKSTLRPKILIALTIAVASVTAHGTDIILHSFTDTSTDGDQPHGALTFDGTSLYGMTVVAGPGGGGIVYRINPDGSGFNIVHGFVPNSPSGGWRPNGSLALNGTALYGMTRHGGGVNRGDIFTVNTDGSGYNVLHAFSGTPNDGEMAVGSLTLSNTILYGMTSTGGSSGFGTVFSLNTDGSAYQVLHSFVGTAGDGKSPNFGKLTLANSKLYGTTVTGGASNSGTIYSMNTDGTGFSLVHSFVGGVSEGRYPYSSDLTLIGSQLYGMTGLGGSNDLGTVFRINLDGTNFTMLHSFSGTSSDGSSPYGSVTSFGSKLYGTTRQGGTNNAGTVFSINLDGSGFSLLNSFTWTPNDGAFPEGDVIGIGSALYGVTTQGGVGSDFGTVFAIPVVPEPASVSLLGLGALLLAARRRSA